MAIAARKPATVSDVRFSRALVEDFAFGVQRSAILPARAAAARAVRA